MPNPAATAILAVTGGPQLKIAVPRHSAAQRPEPNLLGSRWGR
jgi:hypothetical protein